jgi:hypothetical protein
VLGSHCNTVIQIDNDVSKDEETKDMSDKINKKLEIITFSNRDRIASEDENAISLPIPKFMSTCVILWAAGSCTPTGPIYPYSYLNRVGIMLLSM